MKTVIDRPDIAHVFYLDQKKADGILTEISRLLETYEKLTGVPIYVGPLKLPSTPKKDLNK